MVDDTTPPPARRPHTGCGVWFVGEIVAMLVGFGLGVLALFANAPGWAVAVILFSPSVLFTLAFAVIYLPRIIRDAREAARNAPSPESVAAKAHGEGVEAGKTPRVVVADTDDTPGVPNVTTVPGGVLAHGLPRADFTPGCNFGCTVGVAAFWNGIVSIFVVQLVAGWNRMGWFKWLQAAFLVPFAFFGVVLIGTVVAAAFKWVLSWFVGRVEVEVSAHPFVPGGKVRVRVAQRGMVPLGRVSVSLICEESAKYIAGTSATIDKKEVVKHRLADPDDHAGPLPLEFDCAVPADAMHSFEAPNNTIKWTVRISGRVLGLPFRDDYSVVVAPEGSDG